MRRITSILAVVAVMAAMVAATAAPAFANHMIEVKPNEKACQGVIIGGLASSKNPAGPFTPPKVADLFGYSVGEYTESVREGETGIRFRDGGELNCPDE